MNTPSASPADTGPASAPSRAAPPRAATPSRRTVDAPTRVFHGLMALCFAGAYATSDGERWRLVHVTLGYTMAGLLGARVLWGLLGPKPARFASWWRKLQAWPTALQQVRGGIWPATLLQNLGMTLAIVAVLLTVALTTASGWITYQEFTGDWMEEVHELAGNLLLVLVVAHIGLVIVLSLLRQRNLAAPMLTGRQPGPGPDLVKRNLGWLAALLLAAVLGFWWQQWQTAPTDPTTGGSALNASRSAGDDGDDD